MNIVIVKLTLIDLVQHASMTTSHAMTIVVQNKAHLYIELVSRDDFIHFAIETYSCPHPCFDSFFISCCMLV
jgi:hypothetical protein